MTAFFISFASCLSNKKKDCIGHLRYAQSVYNKHLLNNDTSKKDLLNILVQTNSALECPSTRIGAVELKISILLNLKYYKRGYDFVNSLNIYDFKYSYKKQMWRSFFKAKSYEKKGDYLNQKINFHKAANSVKNYIKSNNIAPDNNGEDIYYDFYELKSKISSKEEVITELKKLKNTYPSNAQFIDALIQTIIYKGDKSTTATQNE